LYSKGFNRFAYFCFLLIFFLQNSNMKRITTLVLLVFSLKLSAQSHVLDSFFGENIYDGVNFTPTNVWLVNGSYYFTNSSQILKMNYNGTLDTDFGPNGLKSITLPGNNDTQSLKIKNIGNNFFVLGSVTVSNNKNIFITKLGIDGLPDTTFGVNGTAIIDLGFNERISDFTIDTSGKFLCTGTKDGTSTKLLFFRLNSNGSLDATLNTQGYKEYVTNEFSAAGRIIPYQNNLLLIGTDTKYVNSTRFEELYIIKIDSNGDINSSFGNNGSKIVPLYGGMSISLQDVQLLGNNLYTEYKYAWSSTHGTKIINYDLAGNQVIFNNETYYTVSIQAVSDGFYIAGVEGCEPFTPCNSGNYLARKYTINGNANNTFNSGNLFVYNFPAFSNIGYSRSLVINADNLGGILIAGYTQGYFNAGNGNHTYKSGFSAIRLIPQALGNNQFGVNKVSVYPNPFTDKFTIDCVDDVKSVEVYDLTGRLIGKPVFSIVGDNTVVDMMFTQPGNYILKIQTTGGKTTTHKIIKQ